jgi:hypothetical protein
MNKRQEECSVCGKPTKDYYIVKDDIRCAECHENEVRRSTSEPYRKHIKSPKAERY